MNCAAPTEDNLIVRLDQISPQDIDSLDGRACDHKPLLDIQDQIHESTKLIIINLNSINISSADIGALIALRKFAQNKTQNQCVIRVHNYMNHTRTKFESLNLDSLFEWGGDLPS